MNRLIATTTALALAASALTMAGQGHAKQTEHGIRDTMEDVLKRDTRKILPKGGRIFMQEEHPVFPMGRTDCTIVLEISKNDITEAKKKFRREDPGAISPFVRGVKMRCPGDPN